MDRARSAVTNFIGRYPLSYTRFSLTQQTDGDASQVEMKLADDEECGDQTMGEPVVKQRPENNCKRICMKILLGSFLILLGFLIGYLSHRGRDSSIQSKNPETVICSAVNDCNTIPPNDEDETNMETEMPSVLHWSDLAPILKSKIDNLFLKNSIDKISKISREAGTRNEESVALMVHEEFGQMSLDKVWNDEHYVTLQEPGSSPNKVTLLSDKEEILPPSAYVAYSPAATVTGKLVYCHYGRKEDFKAIQEKKIDLSENLILVRSGLISFAEKVKNAELHKAKGVLIYPEPSDLTFPLRQSGFVDSPFGHAHYGTGDPYTPGFPSFNHTQFPPSKSSGLPSIPVQTISSEDGKKLLEKLDGDNCPDTWQVACKLGPQIKDTQNIKLEVTNVPVEKKIYNVFGVIQGFEQSDHYVVVGAQRDSWGPGVSKAAVGTSLLLELARLLSDMVKTDGFRPRRSIVFASWGAGDFGSVGATEWLEGYLNNLHLKAFSYINLDSAIQGSGTFKVSASPLLNKVILQTLKEVADPVETDFTLYKQIGSQAWTKKIVPFSIEDSAYPFLAYSGIPSVSFSFQKDNKPYAYLGTKMDTLENFNQLVDLNRMCRTAAHFAAQIIIRLTHEQKLPLDYSSYNDVLLKVTFDLQQQFRAIKELNLTLKWVNSARGDFSRAAASLTKEFAHSDLENTLILRSLNDRIMKVEHGMLSPYVSPKDTPFRHIIYGSGNHTVAALMDHLNLLNTNKAAFDADLFKNQLAMLTWTLQGAANSLAGDIWDIDNNF
ncbi:transferrin receptor protein 1 [Xenopus laevis]|uniref:Transferrin receptor protein 1 n=2 Tax=Xenopus laevis TaxID=8355 RepID=A0A1L8G9X7_XENLA|nr:transferrin receptor protein 1 [Xenopus laevis]XP_018119068.1 transferrin receptor protein 1 [Xenopus laevis]XP_018119069.1 transferrin receptor protein 1 [Xenopus laevis]OCT80643.1 hypothetical protein XELAEV_18027456mg [Xenopus laevis]